MAIKIAPVTLHYSEVEKIFYLGKARIIFRWLGLEFSITTTDVLKESFLVPSCLSIVLGTAWLTGARHFPYLAFVHKAAVSKCPPKASTSTK